jgi:hypothetical protein
MKCPHCGIGIAEVWKNKDIGQVAGETWTMDTMFCPDCNSPIIHLKSESSAKRWRSRIYPYVERRSAPPEVPPMERTDFEEAASILALSPRGSAALSRRLLQHLLRGHGKIKSGDLIKEIARREIPATLRDSLHVVRTVGNMAVHPSKNKNTGEIVDVEAGEAEWLLEVLEELMDHLFVQPARHQARRDALLRKLQSVGKQPLG